MPNEVEGQKEDMFSIMGLVELSGRPVWFRDKPAPQLADRVVTSMHLNGGDVEVFLRKGSEPGSHVRDHLIVHAPNAALLVQFAPFKTWLDDLKDVMEDEECEPIDTISDVWGTTWRKGEVPTLLLMPEDVNHTIRLRIEHLQVGPGSVAAVAGVEEMSLFEFIDRYRSRITAQQVAIIQGMQTGQSLGFDAHTTIVREADPADPRMPLPMPGKVERMFRCPDSIEVYIRPSDVASGMGVLVTLLHTAVTRTMTEDLPKDAWEERIALIESAGDDDEDYDGEDGEDGDDDEDEDDVEAPAAGGLGLDPAPPILGAAAQAIADVTAAATPHDEPPAPPPAAPPASPFAPPPTGALPT